MNIGAKAALEMLVKLTPGVNFTNALHAAFLCLFLCLCFFGARILAQKLLLKCW
jgi:hypothetical protein